MGASATWIHYAMESQYQKNPTSNDLSWDGETTLIDKSKELTNFYQGTKNIQITKNSSDNDAEELHEKRMIKLLNEVGYTGEKLDSPKIQSYKIQGSKFTLRKIHSGNTTIDESDETFKKIESMQIPTFWSRKESDEELYSRLDFNKDFVSGIRAMTKVTLHDKSKGESVIKTMSDTPGVYMLLVSTHIMAASSINGNYYFYDTENGLFRCNSSEELYKSIRIWRGGRYPSETKSTIRSRDEDGLLSQVKELRRRNSWNDDELERDWQYKWLIIKVKHM